MRDVHRACPTSSRRDEGLALFDDVGDRDNRGLVAVLAAMRHACGNLESISCLEDPRTLAVDAQFQSPFDDIARFNPRMSVARDQCPPASRSIGGTLTAS